MAWRELRNETRFNKKEASRTDAKAGWRSCKAVSSHARGARDKSYEVRRYGITGGRARLPAMTLALAPTRSPVAAMPLSISRLHLPRWCR